MDFAKFMSRTWKLFVEQEDIGPWEHLWRRANFFFDTDEKFRLETVILSGLIIVMAFLLISLSWICSRRYRKKNNIDLQKNAEIISHVENNRKHLKEVANLLTHSKNIQCFVKHPLLKSSSLHMRANEGTIEI
ncbi:uncharacterized protein LOC134224197 [Armigeres subalbatus]|uniref:uncharacterized protein LOC134224152 n=1 Tax=Armigeres subalbatus TaxID=124917 RepID=UPI002ED22050